MKYCSCLRSLEEATKPSSANIFESLVIPSRLCVPQLHPSLLMQHFPLTLAVIPFVARCLSTVVLTPSRVHTGRYIPADVYRC